MQKTIILSIVTLFALSFITAVAQESTPEPVSQPAPQPEERLTIETRDKATPAMKDIKLEREYRPRLPGGFGPAGANVNAQQRESIYKILTEYNDVIALLELRVELLKKERDSKIDAVLTPAQLQRARPVRVPLLQR